MNIRFPAAEAFGVGSIVCRHGNLAPVVVGRCKLTQAIESSGGSVPQTNNVPVFERGCGHEHRGLQEKVARHEPAGGEEK